MQDLGRGFRIGDRLVPWGTTPAEISGLFVLTKGNQAHIATFPCGDAYGFAALEVELTAPAVDRPVMQVKFELRPLGDDGTDRGHWVRRISEALGEPFTVSESALPEHADPSDSVIYYASWSAGAVSVGLSVYGGPRQVDAGLSSACLWLSCSEELAAQPYLPEWLARAGRLEKAAGRRVETQVFTLEWPQNPPYGYDGMDPEAIGRCWSRLCLYRPEILPTPPVIAALLDPHRFALWRSDHDNLWCASSPWESLVLLPGHVPEIARHEVLPAKGGGFSELSIDTWSVRSSCGSRQIMAAADLAARLAGVDLVVTEGYDC